MRSEPQGGNDAEVTPAAAQCPEEIELGTRPDGAPVGGDDLCVEHVGRVGAEAEFVREPGEAAVQGGADYADVGTACADDFVGG